MIKTHTLAPQVDKLGKLNAKIAELSAEAELIKALLKASGETEIEGRRFKAVISTRVTSRLDSAKVKTLLSPAQIAACTGTSSSTTLSLYDRNA